MPGKPLGKYVPNIEPLGKPVVGWREDPRTLAGLRIRLARSHTAQRAFVWVEHANGAGYMQVLDVRKRWFVLWDDEGRRLGILWPTTDQVNWLGDHAVEILNGEWGWLRLTFTVC